MSELRLTTGEIALVDDEDLPRLIGRRWYAVRDEHTTYAQARFGERGQSTLISLHHAVMQVASSTRLDHRNLDGLDCQKQNLRLTTPTTNSQNRRKFAGTLHPFKGVTRYGFPHRPWRAAITVNKKRMHLGYFASIEEAAHAYDQAAREHFGEFARCNFGSEEGGMAVQK